MPRNIRCWLVLAVLCFFTYAEAQTWRYTGSISSPRRHMSANLLTDGTILIAGGMDATNMSLPQSERYDPATEQWSVVGTMTMPRNQHTTHLLPNGTVVAIAGLSNSITSSVEVFDPVSNSWSSAGTINHARMNHTSTMLGNGLILVAGGFSGDEFMTSCELYDPVSQTSVDIAPLNIGRHDHNAILLQSGKVLITGGRIGGADGIYLSDAEIFDPATNTWSLIADMNSSRIIGTLVEFSDFTVLAAGGRKDANSATTSADLFDPVTQTWTAIEPMHDQRHWQGESLMPSDRYLITGGIKDAVWTNHNDVEVTNTCEWYDKPTSSWFYGPDMNRDRSQHGQIYFTQNVNNDLPRECVIVIGGISTGVNNFTETCEILDVNPPSLDGYKILPRNTMSVGDPTAHATGVQLLGNGSASPVLMFTDMERMHATTIDFVSAQGVKVASIDFGSQHALKYPLDVRSLPNGVYFLRIMSGNNTEALKLIIAK